MKKILIMLVMFASLAMAVVGDPGPLTKGYYYRADLIGQDGRSYTNYYKVDYDGFISICDAYGYTKGGYDDKYTSESANGRMATLTWFNTNGVWTETQTIHFMRDNRSGNREVNVWRSVTNKPGDAWGTYYSGKITSMGKY